MGEEVDQSCLMGFHMAPTSRGIETHAVNKVKYEDVDSSEAHIVVFTCYCQAKSDCE